MTNKLKGSSVINNSLLLVSMLLFGSLFPFVKIGYNAFNISGSSIKEILMFASLRFIISGLIVCIISGARKEQLGKAIGKSVFSIMFMGLFSVILHYVFTYVGLSLTDSSKTALLKQVGALIYVCFSFWFIKDEKFSFYKIVGAIVGFSGIVAININGKGIIFFIGDIFAILASFCMVAGAVVSKICVKGISPLWITGISQLFGGIILFVIAFIMGARVPGFDFKGLLVLSYICAASVIAYTLYYYFQRTISNSKLFIIKF